MAVYLDCNATTPVEPRVAEVVQRFLLEEYGNAGSRTHDYGNRAQQAVEDARRHVAAVLDAQPEEVIFTSGATESNNLAILGLAPHGEAAGKRHIVSTTIEHKAVLEPLEVLETRGFELTLVPCDASGRVTAANVAHAVRDDTLLVSVMHANNETGIIQPIAEIAEALADHSAYLHVDAAQGFGKVSLLSKRVDLISISGHKLFAPKGIGALVARRRKYKRPPLQPLLHGGGQERGLRPGTLPVHLIVGLGESACLAAAESETWAEKCRAIRRELLAALTPLGIQINGDPAHSLPHTLNFSLPGVDSEAVMLGLKGLVAISNGSACTSANYSPSHVLTAMGFPSDRVQGALRFSWCHITEPGDFHSTATALASLQ